MFQSAHVNFSKMENLLVCKHRHMKCDPQQFNFVHIFVGVPDGAFGCGTALRNGRPQVRFAMMSLKFFIDINLPATLWPWGRPACNKNEYQAYFLGGKGGRCIGLTTLAPSYADWSLNLLKPSGPIQACTGIIEFVHICCVFL